MISGEYYANTLQPLSVEITKTMTHLPKSKALLHQDNALFHTFVVAMAKIKKSNFELHFHVFY